MTTHTPGPWHIWTGDVTVLIQNQADPRYPDNLAKVFRNDPNGNDPRPWEANARLIAAAPDLLTALETIADIGGNLSDEAIQRVGGVNDARALAIKVVHARQIARDAIAKARNGEQGL